MTPPVSGCARRRRSSGPSAVPATSRTTGPSGSALARAISASFQHHARAREAFLVADREVVADDALASHHRFEVRHEDEARLTQAVLHHADALERHGIAKPGPHRLGKSLLGREAVRDKKNRLPGFFKTVPLPRSQDTPR